MASAEPGPAPEDSEGGDFELSPPEWQAWQVFSACATQWRVLLGLGMVHYEGIDYGSLQAVIALQGIRRKHHPRVFWMVRVLEAEAAKWINKR